MFAPFPLALCDSFPPTLFSVQPTQPALFSFPVPRPAAVLPTLPVAYSSSVPKPFASPGWPENALPLIPFLLPAGHGILSQSTPFAF